jgi:hypothetical protein
VFVRSIVDGSLFLDSLSLLFVGGFVGLFVVRWFVGWLLGGILGGLVVGLVGVVVGGLVGGVVGGDVGGPLVHLRLVHGPVFWSVGQPAVASSVGRSVVMMETLRISSSFRFAVTEDVLKDVVDEKPVLSPM